MALYPELENVVTGLTQSFNLIPDHRINLLQKLADHIRLKQQTEEELSLNFICTHNSRRSHLGQIWASLAAYYFDLTNIDTYSGGTEATAFNPRAVAALERIGFQIQNPGGDNPHYLVSFSEDGPSLECFSKTFDDPFNPSQDFGAIMTCSDADENCPFIPGAAFRLSLTYEDPKASDGSPQEAATYDERTAQIGREILYAFQLATNPNL